MNTYPSLRDELRAMNVPLPQYDEEFEALSTRVQQKLPRTLVEIGTRDGGSLWMLARLLPTSTRIVSIDLVGAKWGHNSSGANRQRVADDLRARGYDVVLIDGDSQSETTRDSLQETLGGGGIDFLFIDADHTFHGCLRDFELYFPLVNPHGLVAFHDILESKRVPSVKVFLVWRVLKTLFPTEEFTRDAGKENGVFGIGLLCKTPLDLVGLCRPP